MKSLRSPLPGPSYRGPPSPG